MVSINPPKTYQNRTGAASCRKPGAAGTQKGAIRAPWASAPACLTVAALLLAGAALVAGRPRGWPRGQRLGVAGVAATLAGRGLIGVAGLMPQERTSSTFARWNRRLFSAVPRPGRPVCRGSRPSPCGDVT